MTSDPRRGLWFWVAVGGGLGLAPKAPGTFGSLPGLLMGGGFAWFAQSYSLITQLALGLTLIVALIGVGLWSISRYETHTGLHDDRKVVIDEVAGQCIATMWLPPVWWTLVMSFALFRFFDIIKKGPVGYIDRHVKGPWGTLADDLVAGALAMLVAIPIVWL